MILSGLVNVVDGLAEMRNQMGDAHGQGRPVSPWARHAALAVNSAGAVAAFLLETVHERRTRDG